jgi:hypothetical protein
MALCALRQQDGGLPGDMGFVAGSDWRLRRRGIVRFTLQCGGLQFATQRVEGGTDGGKHLGAAIFGQQRLHR